MWRRCFALCVLTACMTESEPTREPPPRAATPDGELAPPPGPLAVGAVRWALSFGDGRSSEGRSIAIDHAGDVVAAISMTQPLITKRAGADGAEAWSVRPTPMTTSSRVYLGGVAIGSDDAVFVTGSMKGTVDFGGQQHTSDGLFVARYTAEGQLVWVRDASDATMHGAQLVVDTGDRVFIMAPKDIASSDVDLALLAFDGDGALLWTRVFVGANGPFIGGLAFATNGDVLIAGLLAAPTSFGNVVLTPTARVQTFVSRWTRDGEHVQSRTVGPAAPYSSSRVDIAVDTLGRVVVQQTERDESGPVTGPDAVDAVTTLRLLDDSLVAQSTRTIVNRGSVDPQTRALTTFEGAIVSSAWTDVPTGGGGSMEVLGIDMLGHSSMSRLGERMAGDGGATTVFDAEGGPENELALAGSFSGTIDFGTGPHQFNGEWFGYDTFIVLVDPAAP